MRSKEYWLKRSLQREADIFLQGEEVIKRVKQSYFRINKGIKKEIEKIQSKLDSLDNFKISDIEAYNFRKHLLKELENKIFNEYSLLAKGEIKETERFYKNTIKNTYSKVSEDIRSVKNNTPFYVLKTEDIKDILKTKWLGNNYSTRVWKNTTLLADELSKVILDGMVAGRSINQMSEQIDKIMKVGAFSSERLIRTEANYFHNQGNIKAYKNYSIKKYEYLAVIDGRTSNLCEELNENVFNVENAQVGENYPPMHPFCRSTTVAYFEDLQENTDSGIIKENAKEDIDVHTVGRIDKNIYKVISNDIATDEVIITDERVKHIKERHPTDYERFYFYLSKIVSQPDYIIAGNKPNTALILKSIEIDGEKFKTILRLKTSLDDEKIKNSIITFMKIDLKEWNRLIRNKDILYKRE